MDFEQNTINSSDENINTWAYIEIFGHHQLAGRITTRKMGTQVMLQVDVPKGEAEFSHSELYSPNSIFSLKPTTESWCRRFAEYRAKAIHSVLPYIPQERQLPEPDPKVFDNSDLIKEDEDFPV
jgi:hypothetical protein